MRSVNSTLLIPKAAVSGVAAVHTVNVTELVDFLNL